MNAFKYLLIAHLFIFLKCGSSGQPVKTPKEDTITSTTDTVAYAPPLEHRSFTPEPGAYDIPTYIDSLKGKKVGLVVNPSSEINSTHLVDTLISHHIDVVKIFAPEHGFRGTADAGETIKDGKDEKTGLPVISLYGNNKKPKPEQVNDLDIIVFDIQDVGVRFYTYISTMQYVMESCAENDIQFMVLDRPNPNGDYVAGPVLDPKFKSFVGMHPIPIVHGLTVGELAKMINGEGWIAEDKKCDLTVVPCKYYTHSSKYELPVKPSPNLPNYASIRLYPSLCLLEPTQVSVGRGTYFPFQVLGSPAADSGFCFTPESIEGMSKNPKHLGKECCGIDFRALEEFPKFTLQYLYDFYQGYEDKANFFTSRNFFNKLMGTDKVTKLLENGASVEEMNASFAEELATYEKMREQYLLYPIH